MYDPAGAGARYRAVDPARALERRGHTVVWPGPAARGLLPMSVLASCDIVLVYRLFAPLVVNVVRELATAGVPVVYDNDDHLAAIPRDSTAHAKLGGLRAQRAFAQSVKVARAARVVTVPSAGLADVYAGAGVTSVAVVPNMVAEGPLRSRSRHDGVVIGWIAALEHEADARALRIADALEACLRRHSDARVESIGVDLRLAERYRHHPPMSFDDTVRRMGGWDVGLAPLINTPFNRSRSDIKVKEYAALGVPWLASPVGPYVGLGSSEGGRLVADDEWELALCELIGRRRERRRLGRRGRRWAESQVVDAAAAEWERVLLAAVDGGGS